ncbi:NAD(P)/FAD-dependent oxidoreductase [Aeromicrobium sp.]|uniref:NAD(P)/FAD-dependent oxidoreductase n=1 Tax=Aeromicrobium sp. TaxID=1871063 RepID=UPI0030BA6A13
MNSNSCDVLIIGAGAAGLSAALVLGRARRRVIVLDGGPPRNAPAVHVNGYLGVDGPSPLELLEIGRRQVKEVGVEVIEARAGQIEIAGDDFIVRTDAGDISARRIVLATGVTDVLPGIAGLREGFGVDVFHCPYCHGHEVADLRLGVIATHPMSGHQARLIRQWSSDVVFFLNDTVQLDAEERRLFAARGVDVVDGPVAEVVRDGGVLRAVRDQHENSYDVDAVFVATTMMLNLGPVAGLGLEMVDTPIGPVVAVDHMGMTSVPGVWAAGNIANAASQVISAAAEGAKVGAMVNSFLIEHEWAGAERALVGAARPQHIEKG